LGKFVIWLELQTSDFSVSGKVGNSVKLLCAQCKRVNLYGNLGNLEIELWLTRSIVNVNGNILGNSLISL